MELQRSFWQLGQTGAWLMTTIYETECIFLSSATLGKLCMARSWAKSWATAWSRLVCLPTHLDCVFRLFDMTLARALSPVHRQTRRQTIDNPCAHSHTDTHTHTQRDTQTHRHTHRHRQTHTQRERETHRHTHTHTLTHAHTPLHLHLYVHLHRHLHQLLHFVVRTVQNVPLLSHH